MLLQASVRNYGGAEGNVMAQWHVLRHGPVLHEDPDTDQPLTSYAEALVDGGVDDPGRALEEALARVFRGHDGGPATGEVHHETDHVELWLKFEPGFCTRQVVAGPLRELIELARFNANDS